jgi:hypothetical protein
MTAKKPKRAPRTRRSPTLHVMRLKGFAAPGVNGRESPLLSLVTQRVIDGAVTIDYPNDDNEVVVVEFGDLELQVIGWRVLK